MKTALPILLLASLTACSTPSTVPVRLAPAPPPLPAALRAPCPPLRPIADASAAALVQGDVDAAFAYADCAARHSAAISAYDRFADMARSWAQTVQE